MSASVAIQSLPGSTVDATRLAGLLGVPCHEIALHTFPDGETRVTIGPVSQTTIIYASLDHPNDKLIALLLATDELRKGGCTRIVLVAPYLCYMRQDAAFHTGEANSQKAIGKFVANLVDRIITVNAHLHRASDIEQIFPMIAAENLSAIDAIAKFLRKSGLDPATVLIAPDSEARQWVSDLAKKLQVDYAVADKVRRGDRSVHIELPQSAVAQRPALIVDDIVSSGETLKTCAHVLADAGASSVDAIVTHALFTAGLMKEFVLAGIRSVRSTYSVPHPSNAIFLDDLLAETLRGEVKSPEGARG